MKNKKAGYLRVGFGLITPIILLLMLTVSAEKAKGSCFDALLLCGRLIIPSLFPFFVLSSFLCRTGLPGVLGRLLSPLLSPLLHISPAGASAFVMGLCGGFPSGANYIAELEKGGMINCEEGERLIAFCNNSGPAFIVGVMGCGIFGSVKTGLLLYAVHALSALLCGLVFRADMPCIKMPSTSPDTVNTAEALVASVKQALSSMLNVCAFVLCFSVLVSMLDNGGGFSLLCGILSEKTGLELHYTKAMLTGILELGSAAGLMQGFAPCRLNLLLTSVLLAWGGLSVHFQTLAVLSESRLKGSLHLAGRLLISIFSFVLMLLVNLF